MSIGDACKGSALLRSHLGRHIPNGKKGHFFLLSSCSNMCFSTMMGKKGIPWRILISLVSCFRMGERNQTEKQYKWIGYV